MKKIIFYTLAIAACLASQACASKQTLSTTTNQNKISQLEEDNGTKEDESNPKVVIELKILKEMVAKWDQAATIAIKKAKNEKELLAAVRNTRPRSEAMELAKKKLIKLRERKNKRIIPLCKKPVKEYKL